MQNFLQINKFYVPVVTLCDIFILDLNNFFGLYVLKQNRFLRKK